jgi:hypothetical protein
MEAAQLESLGLPLLAPTGYQPEAYQWQASWTEQGWALSLAALRSGSACEVLRTDPVQEERGCSGDDYPDPLNGRRIPLEELVTPWLTPAAALQRVRA